VNLTGVYVGDGVEGYHTDELAAYQLRCDPVWQEQVARTNRLIARIAKALSETR
jgi:hypothetical protein